jgi:spermidine/putrescine transport system permease protein
VSQAEPAAVTTRQVTARERAHGAAVALIAGRTGARPRGGWQGRIRRWWGSEAGQGLAMISPPFLYALLLLAAPLTLMLLLSFWTQEYLTLIREFTFANYEAAWTEPLYRLLMWRSLWISALTTIFTVLLAYPIAYYVAFHVQRNRALWLFLITIPFWTSYLLRVFLWKVILGYNGVFNSLLMSLGLIDEPLTFILYDANAVILTLTHAWAPFAILPIYVALSKTDRSLLEAAEDLGDGPLRRFGRVTLPLSMPGVIAAALIVFIPTVGDYVTPKLVGGTDGLMIANMI